MGVKIRSCRERVEDVSVNGRGVTMDSWFLAIVSTLVPLIHDSGGEGGRIRPSTLVIVLPD
jgi:hypothetical protein